MSVNLIIIDNSESHQTFIDSVISARFADSATQIFLGDDSDRLADIGKEELLNESVVKQAFAEIDKVQNSGGEIIFMKGFDVKTPVFLRILLNHTGKDGKKDISRGGLLSHCAIVQKDGQTPFILTDAAIVTYPDKEQKLSIATNAMQMYWDLFGGRPQLRISVISAAGGYNKNIKSAVDGQFLIDNLKYQADIKLDQIDTALFEEKARKKKIEFRQPDIVIAPDFESGNIAYKFLADKGMQIAGLIAGGNYAMVLNSRGDTTESKMLALGYAHQLLPVYKQRHAR